MTNTLTFIKIFVVFLLITSVTTTLSKSDKKKSKQDKKKEAKVLSDDHPTRSSSGRESASVAHIISNHAKFNEALQHTAVYGGETLAYVTPWNNHGYDIAKWFGNKFTYVSPVWLQLKPKGRGRYVIEGSHDIDGGWVSDVTSNGHTEILPRVLFDGWTLADYNALFASEDFMEDCIDVLTKFIVKHKFGGVVIEIWSQLGGQLKSELVHFLKHMADMLHDNNKKIILVIPPPVYAQSVRGMFSHDDFLSLVDSIDRFSLMTYDFSNPSRPGPNSPLDWARQCIELLVPVADSPHRRKILMGLNFYGNSYSSTGDGGPIVGKQYIDQLEAHNPTMKWDASSHEHFFAYTQSPSVDRIIFYPTLESIKLRLDLAQQMGVGVSIWEVGQGLDYFYDLL